MQPLLILHLRRVYQTIDTLCELYSSFSTSVTSLNHTRLREIIPGPSLTPWIPHKPFYLHGLVCLVVQLMQQLTFLPAKSTQVSPKMHDPTRDPRVLPESCIL